MQNLSVAGSFGSIKCFGFRFSSIGMQFYYWEKPEKIEVKLIKCGKINEKIQEKWDFSEISFYFARDFGETTECNIARLC